MALSGGSIPRPEDPAELEEGIRTYPNITFLFHGDELYLEQYILPLMSKYPNVHVTFDVAHMVTGDPWKHRPQRIVPPLDSPDAASQFLANVDRIGIDKIVEQSFGDTGAWFQQHPDRIHWGTDRFAWKWEKPVSDLYIELGRRFIARLPAEVQEAYAYKNALRVFGKYLIPKQ